MSNVIDWMVGQLTKMVMLLALVGSVAHADSYHWSVQDEVEAQQRQIQQQVAQQIADTQRSIMASMRSMSIPDEETHVVYQMRRSNYASSSSHTITRYSSGPKVTNPLALDEDEQVYVPAKPVAKVAPDNVRVTQEQQQLAQMGIPIISGVRTQQEQEALKDHQDANGQWYTAQGRPVANRRAHRTGDAIDTGPLSADQRRKLAGAGWFQPIPQQDPNHWEKITPSTSIASR